VAEYFEKLGFSLPPNVNLADFLMDILSGDVSSDKVSDPKQLIQLWEDRGVDETSSFDDSDILRTNSASYSTFDNLTFKAEPEMGTNQHFWAWFAISSLLPMIAIPFALMEHHRPTSLKAKFGSLFGGIFGLALGSFIGLNIVSAKGQ